MTLASIYNMHFFDSDFLKSVVSDSDTRHRQVSTGQFEGKLKRILLADITIDHGEYNLKLVAEGAFSPDTVTLVIIHRMDSIGKVCGEDLQGGNLMILPAGADAEFTLPENTSWTAINISEVHLAKYGLKVKTSQLFHLDKDAFQRFNQTYMSLEGALSKGKESQAVLQDMILSHFIHTIESLENKIEVPYSDGYLMALNVRDYIIEHITEPLQMYQLCQMTNKSIRTIERVFKQVFNFTVREYHSCCRLHLIRQSLIYDKNTSVSDTALKYGYLHMGHFSQKYKKLFGELPSHTLQIRQ